jgi:hypothetical protein
VSAPGRYGVGDENASAGKDHGARFFLAIYITVLARRLEVLATCLLERNRRFSSDAALGSSEAVDWAKSALHLTLLSEIEGLLHNRHQVESSHATGLGSHRNPELFAAVQNQVRLSSRNNWVITSLAPTIARPVRSPPLQV